MKRFILVILVIIGFCFLGCDKKAKTVPELDSSSDILEESISIQHNDKDSNSNEIDSHVYVTDKSTKDSKKESNVVNHTTEIARNDYIKTLDDDSTTKNAEYTLMGGIDRFKAIVVDNSDSKIIVEPMDGEYEKNFAKQICFDLPNETDNFPTLSIGDKILIYYSNMDINVNPPKLDHVYRYELINV